MAEVTPALGLQVAGQKHPANLFRRMIRGAVPREGVCDFNAASDLAVTAVSGMTVAVARGGAFVQGDDTTDQGMYFVYNDAAKNITLDASDPTNPRIDLIVAHVKDNTEGQAGDTWVLEFVKGTAAASPVEPTLPATALKLASIAVAAAAGSVSSGNITDKRVRALGTELGYAEVTANQTPITTETDLASLSVSVTVPAGGRGIKITAQVQAHSSVVTDIFRLRIKEGATVLQDTQFGPQGSTSFNATGICIVRKVPSAGSHTYKLSLARDAGSGTVNLDASATNPAFILVEAL